MTRDWTRRDLLRATAVAAVGVPTAQQLLSIPAAAAQTCPAGSGLDAVQHVVFLMQENRSFDHYFGTYRGVRGFADRSLAFAQPDPTNRTAPPVGRRLPFRMDARQAACTSDISHAWPVQHRSWNHGRMDGFVTSHIASDGTANAPMTMGYHTRADLPFYYALADAFTVCDSYHCSIFGPTTPNRLYAMTGTIDPAGTAGGPVIENPTPSPQILQGIYSWPTMPEVLQEHGISWKVYSQAGTNNNVLPFFRGYTDPTSPLCRNALLPTFPGSFEADVAGGTLPQVSWVLAPAALDEHPPAPSAYGEWVTAQVVTALLRNPAVWARTVLFVSFDENGGMFDHVAPPVAPVGTADEYLSGPLPTAAGGIRGPIGLGFRVPMIVVSPFARGGFVCSDTFDHTSQLRFLEARFGVRAPNLSAWRRQTVGDLVATLDLGAPDATVPPLPDPNRLVVDATVACGPSGLGAEVADQAGVGGNPGPVSPTPRHQTMPRPEPGSPRRRTNASCPSIVNASHSTRPSAHARGTSALPTTGGRPTLTELLLSGAAVGLAFLRRRLIHP